MGTHTYRQIGVSADYLATQISSAYTATPQQAVPITYQSIDLSDDVALDDLTAAMNYVGWEYDHAGVAVVAKTIAQIIPSALVSDASSIPVASGWVDVLTGSISTPGGSSVGVQVTAVANPSVGVAQVRVIVNGGSFSNTVIGATAYDIPISSQATIGFNAPTSIPDTSPTNTTYTFKLQMQATGVLGSVVPRAGTVMSLIEYR